MRLLRRLKATSLAFATTCFTVAPPVCTTSATYRIYSLRKLVVVGGVGRSLIQCVLDRARMAGSSRVYWTTQTANATGRALYDKMAEHRGFIVYSHEL